MQVSIQSKQLDSSLADSVRSYPHSRSTLSMAEFVYQYGQRLCSSIHSTGDAIPLWTQCLMVSGAESAVTWKPCSGLPVSSHLLNSRTYRPRSSSRTPVEWLWLRLQRLFWEPLSYSTSAPPQLHSSPYSDFMPTTSIRIHIAQT